MTGTLFRTGAAVLCTAVSMTRCERPTITTAAIQDSVQWISHTASARIDSAPDHIWLDSASTVGAEDFRAAANVFLFDQRIAVLDAGRDPHLSILDADGVLLRRAMPHVLAGNDTVRVVGAAAFHADAGWRVVVLDLRGPRLHEVSLDDSHSGPTVSYNLKGALGRSANPMTLAGGGSVIGISGTFLDGNRAFFSADGRRWTTLADSQTTVHGFPRNSIARAIASTSLVALHPSLPRALLVSRFERSVGVLSLRTGEITGPRTIKGRLPAELKRRADGNVVVHWDSAASPNAIGIAASAWGVAVLHCDCQTGRDTSSQRRSVSLYDWDGSERLVLHMRESVAAIGLSDDGTLIGIASIAGIQRLVRWPRVIDREGALAGRIHVAQPSGRKTRNSKGTL